VVHHTYGNIKIMSNSFYLLPENSTHITRWSVGCKLSVTSNITELCIMKNTYVRLDHQSIRGFIVFSDF